MKNLSHSKPICKPEHVEGGTPGNGCRHQPDCTDLNCLGRPTGGKSTPYESVHLPRHDWLGGIAMAALFFAAICLVQQPEEAETTSDQPTQRTETLKVTGMLFMSRSPARLAHDSRGTPQLMLRLVHRIAQRQNEPWTLTWSGQAAADFFAQHGDKLTAGQPLQVTASQLRCHAVGPMTELHGVMESCELAPRAHEATV